jgi:hypothetical protein
VKDGSPKTFSAIPTKLRSALEMAYISESSDSLPITDFAIQGSVSEEDRKRYEAIREVLSTEKKYLDDLNLIIEVYLYE